jgi:hypothetical protein
VPGEFLGIPGHRRQISFRMLHIFEFKQGRISRENVWLDGNAIITQLTAPSAATPPQIDESQQATSAQDL